MVSLVASGFGIGSGTILYITAAVWMNALKPRRVFKWGHGNTTHNWPELIAATHAWGDAQQCFRFHRQQMWVDLACLKIGGGEVGLKLWVKLRCSLPLHNLVSDSADPHYVSDPLPRHRGIIVALDSSEP